MAVEWAASISHRVSSLYGRVQASWCADELGQRVAGS